MAVAPESTAALEVPSATPEMMGTAAGEPPKFSSRRDMWRRFRRNWLAMVGLGIIVLIVFGAIFAPLLTKWDPKYPPAASIDFRKGPSTAHWFGTDNAARDIFARVLYGARISLEVGVLSSLLANVVGVFFGALAGFYGKWVDGLLMRFTDIFLALPYIILAIVFVVVFGHSQMTIILVLGGLGWMSTARIFRSSVLQVKEQDYIEAARAIGCSDVRIIVRHIIPNAIQPVIVYATTFVGAAILSEAALSFLGVGAVDPTPSWGLMISNGKNYLDSAPQMIFFPGLFLFLAVAAFVFLGDGLRDALDPRLRR